MAGKRTVTAVLLVALLGAAAVLGVVVLQVRNRPLTSLIQPGRSGPASVLVARDFSHLSPPASAGNDGQQFYAIARDPLHPTATARYLDRPRYRLQRIGYPLAAWLLHPMGGGNGLILALLAVNVIAAVLAVGALAWWAARRGRSPLLGLIAVLLPGAYMSMRISCADLLATAVALLAVIVLLDGRIATAAVLAVVAVLCKETTLVLFVAAGACTWPRDRRAAAAIAVPPAVAAGALWIALAITFPHAGHQYSELGAPLRGLLDSARYWHAVHDWKPAATVIGSLALGLVATTRIRLRSPFALAAGFYLAIALLQSVATLAYWTSAPRTLYPLGICAAAALLERDPDRRGVSVGVGQLAA